LTRRYIAAFFVTGTLKEVGETAAVAKAMAAKEKSTAQISRQYFRRWTPEVKQPSKEIRSSLPG
jgi:hypothetical protein